MATTAPNDSSRMRHRHEPRVERAVLPGAVMVALLALSSTGAYAQQATPPATQHAGAWQFVPSVALSATYTDNVALDPRGSEKSSWIGEVTPSIFVRRKSQRLDLDATYSIQTLAYTDDAARNTHNQFFSGKANAVLVDDLFFADATGSVGQLTVDPFRAVTTDGRLDSGNRAELRVFSLSPFVKSRIGGTTMDYEARYRYTRTDSDSNNFTAGNDQKASVFLRDENTAKRIRWRLSYDESHLSRQDELVDTTRKNATAVVSLLPSSELRFNVAAGWDSISDVIIDGKSKGTALGGGVDWLPNTRTELSLAAFHRYFGNTGFARFKHRMRQVSVDFDYSRDIVTSRDNLLLPTAVDVTPLYDALLVSQIPDPAQRAAAVEQLFVLFGLPRTTIAPVDFISDFNSKQSRARATIAWLGQRNTATASFFHQIRDTRAVGSSAQGDRFQVVGQLRERGASVILSHKLTPTTSANVTGRYALTEAPDLKDSTRIEAYTANLATNWTPQVASAVGIRFSSQKTETTTQTDIRERAIIGTLNVKF